MLRVGLNDTAATHLERAVFAVEANAFERRVLADRYENQHGVAFLRDSGGMITVGSLTLGGEEHGVTIETWFATYRGHTILFYEACSRMVDHNQVRAWIEKHGFTIRKRTDVSSFFRALEHIDRLVAEGSNAGTSA